MSTWCQSLGCRERAQSGSRLCGPHGHPGLVLFLGRWRTLAECVERVQGDRAMSGVVWALEGGHVVGRLGTFEIRLRAPDGSSEKIAETSIVQS